MEPWQNLAFNIASIAFMIGALVGTIVNLVAIYHCRFRTRKWWTLWPYQYFNEVEFKIFKVSLAFFGMAIIAFMIMLILTWP